MNDIKNWCRIVCVTVIISGILMSLMPETIIKKTYKGFVSLLIIFIFINPLSGIKGIGEIIENNSHSNELSEQELMLQSSDVVLDCAEGLLKERLDTIMAEAGVDAICETFIKEMDGEAYIEKIEIYGDITSYEAQKIESLFSTAIGGDIEIEFCG